MHFKNTLLDLWNSKSFPASSLVVSDESESIKEEFYSFINDALKDFTDIPPENNTDIIIIEPDIEKTQLSISIDQVRKLQTHFSSKSGITYYKFALILSSDKMTLNAANSLLKVLEDTYDNSFIILLTKDESKLIPTIKSRCIKIFENKSSTYLDEELINNLLKILSPDVRFDDKKPLIEAILKEYSANDILNSLIEALGFISKNQKGLNNELDSLYEYFDRNSIHSQNVIKTCMELRDIILKSISSSIDTKQVIFLSISSFSMLK